MNPANGMCHTGWRAIARRLGVRDVRTAKLLVERNGVPVYRLGKFPRLDEALYLAWVGEVISLSKMNDGGRHE